MISKQLRFSDLKRLGIVPNRVTLSNWIRYQNFPKGRLLGPNTRVWDEEKEIVPWLEARPTELKVMPSKRNASKAKEAA
jgi:hypothetical protein